MLRSAVVAVAAAGLAAMVPAATPLAATLTLTGQRAELTGALGYEGGPYPGGFHPTSGSVEVSFISQPLMLNEEVGRSGHFSIPLSPGRYTVTGCGPSASDGSASRLCSTPKTITLTSGEVRHIELVWAYAP